MKKITLIILTLVSLTSFGQNIESITEKVADKICNCLKEDISSYEEIKPEFNRCYDKEFNDIFNVVNSEEQQILVQPGVLEQIKEGIIPTLNTNCEKIRTIIQTDLESFTEATASSNSEACPTNFIGKDLKRIKKLEDEIIAFDGLIIEIHAAQNGKPYYKVELEDGSTVWIASLIKSGYEKEGNMIRILGFVSKVDDDGIAKKYNQTDYHILAFCIIDINSQQIAMLPGSELQVKEWLNGTVPKSQK